MGANNTICVQQRSEAVGNNGSFSGSAVAGLGVFNAGTANNSSKYAIGAYSVNSNQGQVYVLNTNGNTTNATVSLNANATSGVIVLNGEDTGDRFGYDVNVLSDQDGDGNPELLVAAARYLGPLGVNGNYGAVYVVSSTLLTGANTTIQAGNGTGFVRIVFNTPRTVAGIQLAVSEVPDVDGDGKAEVLIGNPFYEDATDGQTGAAFLVSSRAIDLTTGGEIQLDRANYTGSGILKIRGELAGDYFGYDVGYLLNGANAASLVIGAANTYNGRGSVYVVSSTNVLLNNLLQQNITIGAGLGVTQYNGLNANTYVGSSVGRAVNNGVDVLLTGATGSNGTNAGALYVIRNTNTSSGANTTLQAGSADVAVFNGTVAGDYVGYSVTNLPARAGDNNDQIVVGATGTGANQDTGSVYIINQDAVNSAFGNPAVSLSNTSNITIVEITSPNPDAQFGYAVGAVVNTGRPNEIIVGAPYYAATGDLYDGATYTYTTQCQDVSPTNSNSTSIAASISANSTSIAASISANSTSIAASISANSTSIAASISANSTSIAASISANSTTSAATSDAVTNSEVSTVSQAVFRSEPPQRPSQIIVARTTGGAPPPPPPPPAQRTTSGNVAPPPPPPVKRTTTGANPPPPPPAQRTTGSASTGSGSTGSGSTGSGSTGSGSTGTTRSVKAKRNIAKAQPVANREKKAASSSAASAPAPFAAIQSVESGVVGVKMLDAANSGKASETASSVVYSADVSSVMLGAVLVQMVSQVCNFFYPTVVNAEKIVEVESAQAAEVSIAFGKVNSLIEQAQSLLAQSDASADVAAWLSDAAQELKLASEKSVSVSELVSLQVDAEALVSSIASLKVETVSIASETVFAPETVARVAVSSQAMLGN